MSRCLKNYLLDGDQSFKLYNKFVTHGGQIELRQIVVDLLEAEVRRPQENEMHRPRVSLDKVLFLEDAVKMDIPR